MMVADMVVQGQALLNLIARQLPPEARGAVQLVVNGQVIGVPRDNREECLLM